MTSTFCRSNRTAHCRGVAALLIAMSSASLVWAQAAPAPSDYMKLVEVATNYYHKSVDKEMFVNRGARNARKFLVVGVCRGSKPFEENKKEFDAWFTGYYFPMMTDPAELQNLAKLRQDLMKEYFGILKNEPEALKIRARLNEITLDYMKKLVSNNLHPAVRYNAMLIIGDLDSRPPELFGTAAAAEPWNETLETLMQEAVSPRQIDAVRVAAMLGLRRHIELNLYRSPDRQLPEPTVRRILELAIATVSADKPPTGRTPDGHLWLRRLAMDIVAKVGALPPSSKGIVDAQSAGAAALVKILNNPNQPAELRCSAADALGQFRNPVPPGVDPVELAKELGRFALGTLVTDLSDIDAYTAELQNEAAAKLAEGGGRGAPVFGRGGAGALFGEGGGDPAAPKEKIVPEKEPRVEAMQRRLKYRLSCVRNGLVGSEGDAGVLAQAKSQKAVVDSIAKVIGKLLADVDSAPPKGDTLKDDLASFSAKLKMQGSALMELVGEPTAPAAPAGPGPVAGTGPDAGPGPAADAPPGPEVPPGPPLDAPPPGPDLDSL